MLDTALSEGQLSMAEHGERVKGATHAATLGDLQALVSDLQTGNAPVQLPDLSKPRPHSDHASLDRPDPTDNRRRQNYESRRMGRSMGLAQQLSSRSR